MSILQFLECLDFVNCPSLKTQYEMPCHELAVVNKWPWLLLTKRCSIVVVKAHIVPRYFFWHFWIFFLKLYIRLHRHLFSPFTNHNSIFLGPRAHCHKIIKGNSASFFCAVLYDVSIFEIWSCKIPSSQGRPQIVWFEVYII